MNRQIINGNLRQLKGMVIKQWGRMTDDHFLELEGRQEYWAGEMLEAMGIARDESQRRDRQHAR